MKNFTLTALLIFAWHLTHAQFTDDFSDGDFTNNPVWSGDASLFIINGSNQLQSQSPGAATYYLSTPSELALNVEWEFYINLKFGTSGVNFVDVYLTSDNANTLNTQNGYFVRIGNTADEISLYKVEGGVTTLIIDGTDNLVNSTSNNVFRIKVTRDESDTWSLFYDKGDLGVYTLDGTVVDATISTSTHFGIAITQSAAASAVNNHFFDDFFVQNIPTDNTPPALVANQVELPNSIRLTFNENLETVAAENPSNFVLNNGFGNPTNIALTQENEVLIEYSENFTSADYTLTVNNIEDLNGNIAEPIVLNFSIFIPDQAQPREVLISEFMADPSPVLELPDAEYVEIYNNSNKTFDLEGWQFSDATSSVVMPSFILQPNAYVILCANTNLALFSEFGDVVGLSSLPSLNNTGDNLSIKNEQGILIDSLAYDLSWYQDEAKQDGGFSLELINPNNVCATSNNWAASAHTKGGTPGQQNSIFDPNAGSEAPEVVEIRTLNETELIITFSEPLDTTTLSLSDFNISDGITINAFSMANNQISITLSTPIIANQTYEITLGEISDCTGNVVANAPYTFFLFENPTVAKRDIILSEIMANPSAETASPNTEYVELYNNSPNTVNLENWLFTDGSRSATLPFYLLEAQAYVVITPLSAITLFENIENVIGVANFPTLNNSGDTLVLKSETGVTLDSLIYASSWYKDAIKDDGGYSLELINFNNICATSDNWIASDNESGGTPGTENSVFDLSAGQELPELTEVFISEINEITLQFSEALNPESVSESNFSLSPAINISSISQNANVVILTLEAPLAANTTYELTIFEIEDCTGNIFSTTAVEIIRFVNPEVLARDIIFNELMPNPSDETSSPNVEFVELYNRSNKTISLQNWTFADLTSTATLPNYLLKPDSYVVITPDASIFNTSNVLQVNNWPSLNNSGDNIVIYDERGVKIDTLNYSSKWYKSSIKDDGGYSLELIDSENVCSGDDNWIASEDESGATPGKVNSVKSTLPDNIGPSLLTAFGLSADTVLLSFSEVLSEQSINGSNFSFSDGLEIKEVFSPDLQEVVIVLTGTTTIQSGREYSVEVENVFDCPGNRIMETAKTAAFSLLETAAPNEILINEILFNPRSGGVDFVEIYNTTTKFVNLKNWQIANADLLNGEPELGTVRVLSNENLVLGPQQYLAITDDEFILQDQYPKLAAERIFQISSLPAYSDSEGVAVLLNDKAERIDFFVYSEEFHAPILTDSEGISLERIDLSQPTNLPQNWTSAASNVGYATPGYANSQQRGNLEFADGEVTIAPKVIIPEGRGERDFATITYSFTQSGQVANVRILDVNGRLVKQLAQNDFISNQGFYIWDGTDEQGQPQRVGYYIVYFEVFNSAGGQSNFKEKIVIGSRF